MWGHSVGLTSWLGWQFIVAWIMSGARNGDNVLTSEECSQPWMCHFYPPIRGEIVDTSTNQSTETATVALTRGNVTLIARTEIILLHILQDSDQTTRQWANMGKYLCDPVQIFSLSEKNISNDIEIVSISTGRKHINYDCVYLFMLSGWSGCGMFCDGVRAGASCIRL